MGACFLEKCQAFVQQRRFQTCPDASPAENASVLEPCFLRHLLPGDLGAGIDVRELAGPGVDLFAARYGCPSVRAWGSLPSGRVMLVLIAEAPTPVTVNGVECPRNSLLMIGEGGPVFIRTQREATFLACLMERSRLPVAWQVALSASPDEPANFLVAPLPEASGSRLAAALGHLMDASGAHEPSPTLAGEGLEVALGRVVASLPPPSGIEERMRRAPLARRHALLAALLRERAPDAPGPRWTVPELMERLGVRRRTLEYDIQALAGMSPHAWLTALRLEHVRVELTRDKAASVGDVAGRWGFFHQGRFARAYRLRFGELPRITAARSAGPR